MLKGNYDIVHLTPEWYEAVDPQAASFTKKMQSALKSKGYQEIYFDGPEQKGKQTPFGTIRKPGLSHVLVHPRLLPKRDKSAILPVPGAELKAAAEDDRPSKPRSEVRNEVAVPSILSKAEAYFNPYAAFGFVPLVAFKNLNRKNLSRKPVRDIAKRSVWLLAPAALQVKLRSLGIPDVDPNRLAADFISLPLNFKELGNLMRSEAESLVSAIEANDEVMENIQMKDGAVFLRSVLDWSKQVTDQLSGDIQVLINAAAGDQPALEEALTHFTSSDGDIYIILPQNLKSVAAQNVKLLFMPRQGKFPAVPTAENSNWMPVVETVESGSQRIWNPSIETLKVLGQGELDSRLDPFFKKRAELIILGTIAMVAASRIKELSDLSGTEIRAELLKALFVDGKGKDALSFGNQLTVHLDRFAEFLETSFRARAQVGKSA